MPETTTTTVTKDDRGYYRTPIPKALADGLGLDHGDKIEWRIESGNRLSFRVVDDD